MRNLGIHIKHILTVSNMPTERIEQMSHKYKFSSLHAVFSSTDERVINLLKPNGYVMHQQV